MAQPRKTSSSKAASSRNTTARSKALPSGRTGKSGDIKVPSKAAKRAPAGLKRTTPLKRVAPTGRIVPPTPRPVLGRTGSPKVKVSVTIDADVMDELNERVEQGERSEYFTAAVLRQLKRDKLKELVAAMESEADDGPITDAEIEEAVAQWHAR